VRPSTVQDAAGGRGPESACAGGCRPSERLGEQNVELLWVGECRERGH